MEIATVFPVIVAAVLIFFQNEFQSACTAHGPYYTASAVTIEGRLLLQGGYYCRAVIITGNTVVMHYIFNYYAMKKSNNVFFDCNVVGNFTNFLQQ